MSLVIELQEAQEKLKEFIDESGWTIEMNKDSYPITFTFTNGQTSMFADAEELPEIKFIFKSEIQYVLNIPDDMRVDEKFFNKLKTLSKEVHRLYLLHWFSEKDKRYSLSWKPMFKTINGDHVGLLKKTYRP
ncbi:MAG: hypothetical protein K0R80_126 [Clostridia bacterium]|jgi:hypothetical protein|nr:hypothetical protein [Clostridia bacterium]